MEQTKEYTWKDLEAAIGEDFGPEPRTSPELIDRSTILTRLQPVELSCPLHYDDDVARQHGYKGIFSLACSFGGSFSMGPLWRPGDPSRFTDLDPHAQARMRGLPRTRTIPMPKVAGSFVTDVSEEYFTPIYVGDRITAKGHILRSVLPKTTSVGVGAFVTFETNYFNQDEELLVKRHYTSFNFVPHETQPQRNAPERPTTPQTSGEVLPASEPKMDWSEQLYYEDIEIGAEVPPIVLYMTVQRLIEEAAAVPIFAGIHSDPVIAQLNGSPEIFVSNATIRAWWERCVRESIGLDGKIRKLGPLRIRMFTIPGDVVVTKGNVKRKWQEEGENLVELEVWSEHQRGIAAGPGPVIVTLPSRNRA